ncbi:MAG: Na+/H+ antiporter NhaA [Chloroflexi bacterium]|nr:Na+/H+ antiporter NhaA [Chloroflexota bacterium]|tara:strand:+ start:14983 stop:16320 length:1338 start_codon:yes stop_codon:yes gene_type:complete
MNVESPPPGVYKVRLARPIQHFLQTESASGFILLVMAILALTVANSPFSSYYGDFLHHHIAIDFGFYSIDRDLHFWINDAAMVLFFFLVGMEIKRELVVGELASIRRMAVPAAAATGGMVVPALIFFLIVDDAEARSGWAIPMATDIAFAVGVLMLLRSRVSTGLLVLLLAMAIVDDLGAIAVIALFYTATINVQALIIVFLLLALIYFLNRIGVWYIPIYFLIGAVAWVAMLESGVHTTIMGVLLGLMTPWRSWNRPESFSQIADPLMQQLKNDSQVEGTNLGREERIHTLMQVSELGRQTISPLDRLEHTLQRPVAFAIVPIFAFANAGVYLSMDTLVDVFNSSLTWGITLGLLLGKPIGVTLGVWIAVKLGARLPLGVNWLQIVGIGFLGGIGFTVSLFVTELSFNTNELLTNAKVGILVASLLSGIIGYILLRTVTRATKN